MKTMKSPAVSSHRFLSSICLPSRGAKTKIFYNMHGTSRQHQHSFASKAWYNKSSAPTLIRKFVGSDVNAALLTASKRSIEVWTTTCVVTNFGMKRGRQPGGRSTCADDVTGAASSSSCSVLINPANPSLSGVSDFPYFPRGGPQPKKQPSKDAHHIMGHVTQWGGMDVGEGMMFSAAVVDGLVHQFGGLRLAAECKLKGLLRGGGTAACPEGTSVVTSSGGPKLRAEYDYIVHTVPPFFKHPPKEDCDVVEMLRNCYRFSFDLAFGTFDGIAGDQRVAVPLLGAGCRGFPTDIAIKVAAEESAKWMDMSLDNGSEETSSNTSTGSGQQVIAFGLLEEDIALKLIGVIEESSCALKQ